MIGDKDLNILEEMQSTPWLRDSSPRRQEHRPLTAIVYKTTADEDDDHLPFLSSAASPSSTSSTSTTAPTPPPLPDGYHHTAQDTIDKISPKSLQISADLFLETIRLINQR